MALRPWIINFLLPFLTRLEWALMTSRRPITWQSQDRFGRRRRIVLSGSETRARIGTAIAVLLVASIYADVAIPLEFELDKRGRATDVPVPLDLTGPKFLGKLAWSCHCSSPSRPTSPSRASSRDRGFFHGEQTSRRTVQ